MCTFFLVEDVPHLAPIGRVSTAQHDPSSDVYPKVVRETCLRLTEAAEKFCSSRNTENCLDILELSLFASLKFQKSFNSTTKFHKSLQMSAVKYLTLNLECLMYRGKCN